METHRLELIYSLFQILNSSTAGEPEFILSKYFLDNYNRIGQLNIFDIAEECFVSRSTIRRFCKQLGYDNFLDLKKDFKNFDYQYQYFTRFHRMENYRTWYANEINASVQEVDNQMTQKALENIATQIHDCENVLFLVSYSTAQSVMEFQRPLILLNKTTRLMTNRNINQNAIDQLTTNDLIIMISVSGSFASVYTNYLEKSNASKLLITASYDHDNTHIFDQIFHLTSSDYSNVKSVRGKIGILYALDLLFDVYYKKYKTDKYNDK